MELSNIDPAPIDWSEAAHAPIDVLLIVVNDNEFRPVYEILSEPKRADSGTVLGNVYFGTIGKNRVALVKSGQGAGGKTGTQAILTSALKKLKSEAVICVGICFGMNRTKQKCADVLVSKRLSTYAPCRHNPDGSVFSRGVTVECNGRLVRLFDDGKVGWKGPCQEQIRPDIQSGLIISGPELLDNKDRKEELKKMYPEALGGEMEGEGKKTMT